MSETEERDWSEIFGELRDKARKEVHELAEETEAKVKELVSKARKANLREEADELLHRLKTMAEKLSDRGKPSKPASTSKSSASQAPRAIFQNPDNPEQTYTSRGPKPDWMKKLEKKGRAALKKAITNWEELEDTTRKKFD